MFPRHSLKTIDRKYLWKCVYSMYYWILTTKKKIAYTLRSLLQAKLCILNSFN